jgi:hypothetical protein
MVAELPAGLAEVAFFIAAAALPATGKQNKISRSCSRAVCPAAAGAQPGGERS